jgi:hypothetical protein
MDRSEPIDPVCSCCFAFGTYGAAPRAKATPEGTYGGASAPLRELIVLDMCTFEVFPLIELLACELLATKGWIFKMAAGTELLANARLERLSEVPLASESREPPRMPSDVEVLRMLPSTPEVLTELALWDGTLVTSKLAQVTGDAVEFTFPKLLPPPGVKPPHAVNDALWAAATAAGTNAGAVTGSPLFRIAEEAEVAEVNE